MMNLRMCAALSLSATCIITSQSLAAEIKIVLGGDFYKGGPAYEILAEGSVIHAGVIHEVRDNIISLDVGTATKIEIAFLNDEAAPRETDGTRPASMDRNLIIQSMEFDGSVINGQDFQGTQPLGDFGILYVNSKASVILPQPSSNISAPPINCDQNIFVGGFISGSSVLSEENMSAIEEFSTNTNCRYTVTGYSSIIGSTASNNHLARERADAVAEALNKNGQNELSVDVIGGGETSKFGPNTSDNQVVTIYSEKL